MDVTKKLSNGFVLTYFDAEEIVIKKNKNLVQVKALGYLSEAEFQKGSDSALEHHLEFPLDASGTDVQKVLSLVINQIPDKLDKELNPDKFVDPVVVVTPADPIDIPENP